MPPFHILPSFVPASPFFRSSALSNSLLIRHRTLATTLYRPHRPRASAAGAGAPAGPNPVPNPVPDSDSSPTPPNHSNPAQNNEQNVSQPPIIPSSPSTSPFSQLSQPAITIDPVKNVPTSLIDASGALQIDDGALSAVPILPRRLVNRKKNPLDFETLKSQLRSGFDTGLGSTVLLMLLFATWYWSNTVFNVYNKQVLKVFPYPLTCTVVQFAVAACLMTFTWLTNIKSPPRFNKFLFKATLPLAVLHAAGFLLTNMSLGKVSVAFTHTVKSTEPFFSVALTPSILGDVPTWGILVSLLPIVAGVALASANDISFNWIGFLAAVGSNLALQSRNVLSKRLMNANDNNGNANPKPNSKTKAPLLKEEEDTLMSLDNINLFSTMSILAFLVLMPVCLFWEGPLLTAAAFSPLGMSTTKLYTLLIMGGVCRCLDVLVSYMILKRVSAVTHSVGNCVKRAVVIVSSIIFFKTQMTALSIIGTTMALVGVLLYSLIVSACKQNSFGPESPMCKPIYETDELELTQGGGI